MYILGTKVIDSLVSLTASEEVATFEDSNLQVPLLTKLWRSTSKYPFIVGQLDSAMTPNALSILGTNAVKSSGSDWVRLRLATSQANLTNGSAVVDENFYLYAGASKGFFGAYSFVGTGDVDFGNIVDKTTNSFSVQVRAQRVQSATVQTIGSKGASQGYSFRINTLNEFRVRLDDGVATFSLPSDTAMSTTEFETWTFVVDRSDDLLRIYLGTNADVTPMDISTLGSLTNTDDFELAPSATVKIDEVRVWNRILSSSDLAVGGIADIASELNVVSPHADLDFYWRANESSGTTAIDESGNSNDGTITNGTKINTLPLTYPDLSNYSRVHSRGLITNPASASWFRLDFDGTDNTDGFIEASGIALDAKFAPAHRFRDPTDNEFSRAGVELLLAQGALSRFSGTWKNARQFIMTLSDAELNGSLRPLLRNHNFSLPVVIVFSTDEVTNPMEEMRYGYLDIEEEVYDRSGGKWDITAGVREV